MAIDYTEPAETNEESVNSVNTVDECPWKTIVHKGGDHYEDDVDYEATDII